MMTKKNSSFLSLLFVLLLVNTKANSDSEPSHQCAAQGDSCIDDCDCCTNIIDPITNELIFEPNVRCEMRNKVLGRRCYFARATGSPCSNKSQCKSQMCKGGQCVPNTVRKKITTPLSPIYLSHVVPVRGLFPRYDNCTCDEPRRAAQTDAAYATDENEATPYVNNHAINSGLILYPITIIPLHSIKICNSADCEDCDPMSYKLEGSCDKHFKIVWGPHADSIDDHYHLIQEGKLQFTSRGQCINLPVIKRGFFDHYRLTFPTRRGHVPICGHGHVCEETYPLKVTSVILYGKWNQLKMEDRDERRRQRRKKRKVRKLRKRGRKLLITSDNETENERDQYMEYTEDRCLKAVMNEKLEQQKQEQKKLSQLYNEPRKALEDWHFSEIQQLQPIRGLFEMRDHYNEEKLEEQSMQQHFDNEPYGIHENKQNYEEQEHKIGDIIQKKEPRNDQEIKHIMRLNRSRDTIRVRIP